MSVPPKSTILRWAVSHVLMLDHRRLQHCLLLRQRKLSLRRRAAHDHDSDGNEHGPSDKCRGNSGAIVRHPLFSTL